MVCFHFEWYLRCLDSVELSFLYKIQMEPLRSHRSVTVERWMWGRWMPFELSCNLSIDVLPHHQHSRDQRIWVPNESNRARLVLTSRWKLARNVSRMKAIQTRAQYNSAGLCSKFTLWWVLTVSTEHCCASAHESTMSRSHECLRWVKRMTSWILPISSTARVVPPRTRCRDMKWTRTQWVKAPREQIYKRWVFRFWFRFWAHRKTPLTSVRTQGIREEIVFFPAWI